MATAGSSFSEYLLKVLKKDDHQVFWHIKGALENPDIKEKDDYLYLIKAINDVASARGKSRLAAEIGMSRQGLHKILTGASMPSIQNIIAILNALGLRFSVEQVQKAVSDKPAKVLDVAQYASARMLEQDKDSPTYMKLQKIIYYAQVESLLNYETPLFEEKVLAWSAGPVVKELFYKHKGHKYLSSMQLGDDSNLSVEQKSCIDWTIEKYGNLDGDMLSHITHLEAPWRDARKGLPYDAPSNREIAVQAMIDYYTKLPEYEELDNLVEEADESTK